jgi:predicted DNA-binding ribbon-helix-helix protein
MPPATALCVFVHGAASRVRVQRVAKIDGVVWVCCVSKWMKRSVKIRGRILRVSLEAPFWLAIDQIAQQENTTAQDLVARIDDGRLNAKLSTAIRIFTVNHYRSLRLPGIIPFPLVQPDTSGSAQKRVLH